VYLSVRLHRDTGSNGSLYGYFKCRGRQERICDLPYLPALVERAVLAHAQLALPEHFIDNLNARLQEALADHQQTTQTLHTNLRQQLTQLGQQEERLLDLAAVGALLHRIDTERKRIREGLEGTSEQLAVGAAVLRASLDLLRDPQEWYRHAPDLVRRALDQTFLPALLLG